MRGDNLVRNTESVRWCCSRGASGNDGLRGRDGGRAAAGRVGRSQAAERDWRSEVVGVVLGRGDAKAVRAMLGGLATCRREGGRLVGREPLAMGVGRRIGTLVETIYVVRWSLRGMHLRQGCWWELWRRDLRLFEPGCVLRHQVEEEKFKALHSE